MSIQVICPGCHTRFQVADKFAGQQGPCPKCKEKITIPLPEDEVVIHSPEHSEEGAVGVSGEHVLKTSKKSDAKFAPLLFAAVIAVVLVALLIAIVMRGWDEKPAWALILAAVVLGPSSAWAGYTFLRDDELEGYQGLGLAVRSIGCGLVYALLWGVYLFVGGQLWGADAMAQGLEIFEMLTLVVPILAIGTGAAYVAFDLEPASGFFHCAMYFGVTVLLRLVAGMSALPGLGEG